MKNQFRRWWRLSTTADKDRLAKLAGTSKVQLSQIAGKPNRTCSPALARRIELGIARISSQKLPVVLRGDLAVACHHREYFRKCTQVPKKN